jgi:hypothetical protein
MPVSFAAPIKADHVTPVDERRPGDAQLINGDLAEEHRLAIADSASFFWYPGSFSLENAAPAPPTC